MDRFISKKNVLRFSHVSDFYHRYRPAYPDALFDFLLANQVIGQNKKIVDIGAGTGIFSRCLLERGAQVYAVEPNDAMRAFAETDLSQYPLFTLLNATAEHTSLPAHSMDAVSAATAFHWFNRELCSKEFRRILKPEGWVILVWNLRWPEISPMLQDYEDILQKYCPDYKNIPSRKMDDQDIIDFLGNSEVLIRFFPYEQCFDLQGFIGRLRSTSYALRPGQLSYEEMIADLKKLFNSYQINNKVVFPYRTKLYLGKFKTN